MSTEAFAPAVFPRLRDSDADAERRRARQRGYADGHAEGFRVAAADAAAAAAVARAERERADADAARALASALAALESAADALAARTAALAQAEEQRISALAVELAETIVGEALADRDFAALSALRRALSASDGERPIEVRLSAADQRLVHERGAVPPSVSLVVDDTLTAGDALVVLDDGIVDARIDAALERARRALDEVSP
ncbi:FliH/SctL family protein [Microbacterium sp. NPDC089987]|uniref:FliH/SctL family protein n=1 Tax=Microbacterium sp. NPDC089987 TaxID=3364202 RepID=UPI003809C510